MTLNTTELIARVRYPYGAFDQTHHDLANALESTVKEMHARELHHFEEEKLRAEAEAKLREAEAVIEKELLRHREKHGETPRFAPDDYQHELEPTHWEPYVICDACGTFWPCKTTQTLVYKPTNQEGGNDGT